MGGLEKCLINLCDNFDYTKYDVDLYLFNEGRTLLGCLNKNVNLLPDSPYYKDVYNRSVFKSVFTLLKSKKPGFAWYRFVRFMRIRLNDRAYRNGDWKIMRQTMLNIDKHYDVAIGFAEGTSCYYVAECVDADVKIGWIHTDLKMVNHNRELDQKAFEQLDHVVTVSQNSLNSLIELHPKCKEKFVSIMMLGLMDFSHIDSLAAEPNELDKNTINILSVGRLVELKGFHLCVEPCKRLIDEGYDIKWYVCGEGAQRLELEELIAKYDVKDAFILLGNKENPYTYINSADICVQPSRYEGLSLVIYEEKHFKKSVVCSRIPSYLEMIEDGINGMVVERDSDSIYKVVKQLLDDRELLHRTSNSPAKNLIDAERVMCLIENLFIK